jgi:hypothetical protein
VKNLGVRKSVFYTIWYQLSHCGLHRGNHSVTWFGICSYSSLKVEIIEIPRTCPWCGAPLVRVQYVGNKEPPPTIGEFAEDPADWVQIQGKVY